MQFDEADTLCKRTLEIHRVHSPPASLEEAADTTDPPPPPSSDTDSTVDGSQWDSYIPTPFYRLPSSAQTSPLSKSPWSSYTERPDPAATDTSDDYVGLMTSLVREEGHIYSLAASGDLLYTGSSIKNIRVWKSQKEYSGFKAHSGLVKSIVLSGGKIFAGHQDGKIRVWKALTRDPKVHKKIGTLPSFGSVIKKSMIPNNYTEMWRIARETTETLLLSHSPKAGIRGDVFGC
ncbi:hypothetical protein LXL04_003965 [Taraxacum kok-saghyz]